MAVLAGAGARGMSREKVSSLLWPDTADSGRGALKQTMYELRQTLVNHSVVIGTADLSLDAAAITCDVSDLEAAYASEDWARVVELYTGPFLDRYHVRGSAEFDHWVDSRRARYAELFRHALENSAVGAAEQGDGPASAALWRRLAAEDPLNSGVAHGLMNALAAIGDAAGALTHYRVHERLLGEELGTQPDAVLKSTVERIRSGSKDPAESDISARATPEVPAQVDQSLAVRGAVPSTPSPRKRTYARKKLVLVAMALAIVATAKLVAMWLDRTPARILASIDLPANSASRVSVDPNLNKVYVDGGASFDHALTVIDGGTFEARKFPYGSGAAVDPLTRWVWSGNYGGHFVAVRNGRSDAEIGRIPVPGCPHHFAIDSRRTWVAQQCDDHITVIDNRTRSVIRHIPMPTFSRAEVGGAKGMGEIFVNRPTGIVYFWKDMIPHRLDPRSWQIRETEGIDGPIIGINEFTNRLYARLDNGLQVIDGATERVVAHVQLAGTPSRVAVGFGGRQVYVATKGDVSAIDGVSHRIVWSMPFTDGFSPTGVAADDGRGRLYVLAEHPDGRRALKILGLRR